MFGTDWETIGEYAVYVIGALIFIIGMGYGLYKGPTGEDD